MRKWDRSRKFTQGWGTESEKTNKKLAFYRRYTAMRARCYQPNRKDYQYYGGKGIEVKWQSFEEFYLDMWDSFVRHIKKHGIKNTTLDRIDTDGHYSKDNCRWATRKKQSRNSSRPHSLKYKGKTYSLRGLAKEAGLKEITLWRRLFRYGMSIEDAVTTPVKLGAKQYAKAK